MCAGRVAKCVSLDSSLDTQRFLQLQSKDAAGNFGIVQVMLTWRIIQNAGATVVRAST